jgi:hypothetical protein
MRSAIALDETAAALDASQWEATLEQCCSHLNAAAIIVYGIETASCECLFHTGFGLPKE